jgi:hypothetical protein
LLVDALQEVERDAGDFLHRRQGWWSWVPNEGVRACEVRRLGRLWRQTFQRLGDPLQE